MQKTVRGAKKSKAKFLLLRTFFDTLHFDAFLIAWSALILIVIQIVNQKWVFALFCLVAYMIAMLAAATCRVMIYYRTALGGQMGGGHKLLAMLLRSFRSAWKKGHSHGGGFCKVVRL